ncbi:MAG TPA: hypothetical protein VE912_11830, partial [Bacteroidales bacterium]|nr:hypothetical protein [Bacteroidales bacterium]
QRTIQIYEELLVLKDDVRSTGLAGRESNKTKVSLSEEIEKSIRKIQGDPSFTETGAPTGSAINETTDQSVNKEKEEEKTNERIESQDKVSEEEKEEVKRKVKSSKNESAPLGEKLIHSKTFINESLAKSQEKKDLASVLQSKPLKNIESAIGLNDKFLFVRELFKGDAELYTKTIARLNAASDFNDAYNFINNNFNWDMDSYPVQKLLELVRRKLITHK